MPPNQEINETKFEKKHEPTFINRKLFYNKYRWHSMETNNITSQIKKGVMEITNVNLNFLTAITNLPF